MDARQTAAGYNYSRTRLVRRFAVVTFLTFVVVIGGWAFTARDARRAEIGADRLVVSAPLPPDSEESCEWTTVDAALAADAGFPDESAAKESPPKQPVRIIRDPYASYSSVAVDAANDEVVLTDENLFNVVVYNRLENSTGGAVSKPKRVIGGLKTKIEFQSGLYLDPKNGDIYAVNNDTVDRLVIFSRQASGDVRPDRQVHTPHGTFAMVLDEEHQEILLTVQHDSAVVTFAKATKTEVAPIRLLQGEHTLLADPHGIALDAKNDLIFVVNHGSVHQVQPGKPTLERTFAGGDGKANWPLGFGHAIPGSGKNLPPSILVCPASASGDTAPSRVMKGPKTLLKNPTGVFVDGAHGELWVANFGNHTAAAYKLGADGDVAPLRVIRGAPPDKPTLSIGNPHPVAYDGKREQILVPN